MSAETRSVNLGPLRVIFLIVAVLLFLLSWLAPNYGDLWKPGLAALALGLLF